MKEDAENRDIDAEIGQGVGSPFEEKFLLSLIDAHPEARDCEMSIVKRNDRRLERLRLAMKAIFAQDIGAGRPVMADHSALRWMGQEHCNDLAQRNMSRLPGKQHKVVSSRSRSMRELAKQAAKRFYPDHQDVSERLRKRFELKKSYWLEVAMSHDDVPETLEAKGLERIASILKRFDVAMSPAVRG